MAQDTARRWVPEIIENYSPLNLKAYWIWGVRQRVESRMTQRFLVWATQRIKLLFIKIENIGGEAGLGEL